MELFLYSGLILLSFLLIGYFQIARWIWSTGMLAVLVASAYWGQLSIWGYAVLGVFAVFYTVLNFSPLRKKLTGRLFAWFVKQVPPMSSTEKEAIEAGDVFWEQALFQGKPDWKHCLALPEPKLSDAEQHFLDNQVHILCEMLNDWEIVHERSDLPEEVWEYLKEEKFFGLIIPKAYGGLEFSAYANSCIVAKIATRSVSAAVTVMVPNSLGPAELLMHYGTKAQKDIYLPRLATGQEIPCFGLTSPEAGSDAGAIPDEGIVCKGMFEGRETLGIKITFNKRYITLAPKATVMGLAFKLNDPDKLLSQTVECGITVCLLPLNHEGVECGKRHFPLNQAFMNGPVRGTDVFVPLDWIIGGAENKGQGWRMLMECLSAGRGISLPSMSTATGVMAFKMTGAYAAIRKQFNQPIGQFEGVGEALAAIGGLAYTLQAARHFTISALCQGLKPSVATAISKYQLTEISRTIMNHAMDIHAGRGIMLGPNNYIGRGYQALPVSITVEGANILTRCLIIFGQGTLRCHPHLYEELKAVGLNEASPKQALNLFDTHIVKHMGYTFSTTVRAAFMGLTRGRFSQTVVNDATATYVRHINWLSAAFAVTSEVALLILGGALKRKELLSGRFADVLSQLYLASSVFKYYQMQRRPVASLPLVQWSFERALYLAQEALFDIYDNFPSRKIGYILQKINFPFGRAFKKPKDNLIKPICELMQTENDVRERLTELCFVSASPTDPAGAVERAFQYMLRIPDTLKKMNQVIRDQKWGSHHFATHIERAFALALITTEEREHLLEYDRLRKSAIAVDEFHPDYPLGTQTCQNKPMQRTEMYSS